MLAASRIAKELLLDGFAVFRFDFTGLGESEGDFSNTTFSSNIEDLVAAANYLRTHRQAPTVLIGHSLGGAAVLSAANKIPEVRGVCTIGSPADPKHLSHYFDEVRDEINTAGEAEVKVGAALFELKNHFLEDLAWHHQEDCIKNLGKGLLIFHSPVDEVVGIENAAQIYKTAMHPKSFISLDGANHMLTDKTDAHYVADVISAWVRRYGFCRTKK